MGQSDPQVKFVSRGNGYSLFLTDTSAVLTLSNGTEKTGMIAPASRNRHGELPGKNATSSAHQDVLRMEMVGAARGVSVQGAQILPGFVNYFIGNDPAKWHTGVPTYARIKYAQVYPGVDLVYYGNQRQLEYDFVVAAGADPKPVQLHFVGANKLRLAQRGDLTVTGEKGDLVFHKPVVYQLRYGKRERVAGRFRLMAGNNVRFAIGKYDRTKELIIDPVLTYSTYFGGASGALIRAMTVDSSGDAYLTGEVYGGLPTTAGAYQSVPKNTAKIYSSAFVTKINAAGTALLYETYLGGSGGFDSATGSDGGDTSYALAVDSSGNAFIAGQTDSADFPTSASAFQKSNEGVPNQVTNGFVTKLNPTGSALLYSTFLGGAGVNGNGGDSISSIAVDASGNAYLSGGTYSSNFPLAGSAFQKTNKAAALLESNAFVAKLNSTGSALVYSTYLGGTGNGTVNSAAGGDAAGGIAIDATGDVYVSGATGSSDFPITSGAFQNSNKAFDNAETNGFVTEINPAGSALLYSTYLGGSGLASQAGNGSGDVINSVALTSSGDIYVSGDTISTNFPVSATAFQNKNSSSPTLAIGCGFVARINPTDKALVYSTYLCGTAGDLIVAPIAVDSAGNAYVAGQAFSVNFPVTKSAYQGTNNASKLGTYNAFLTELNATMTGLVYSSYFGGHGYQSCVAGNCASIGDFAYGLAIDTSGDAYLAGWSFSPDFPITKGAYQTSHTPALCSFVAKFNLASSGTTVATSTSLTSDAATQTDGVKVTFTAYVQHTSGTVVPTGTVSFTVDNGTPIVVSLDSTAHAAYATSTLSIGTHSIKATYSGDSNYLASSSPSLTETITAPPAATPTFSPAAGSYHITQSVKIADSTAGSTIYYTTNGSTPTTSSTKYTAAITVSATETIKAIALAAGYSNSAVASATYTIAPAATPTFSPAAGSYHITQSVKIADSTADSTTYYTTNGSTPTTSSTKYTAAITVSATETIKAIAVAAGYNNSAVASATYTIKAAADIPAVKHGPLGPATPTFSPAPGTYMTGQTVRLSDTTPGAVIYFTTNGTTPPAGSTRYTGPILVTATTTIKAIAAAPDFPDDSAVATGAYVVK